MSYRLPNLKTLREAAGLSITQLATRANSSDFNIARLELPDLGGPMFTISQAEAQRIAAVLATDLTGLGAADLAG